MIDLMLGNSPDAFSCGEVVALFRPWRTHHFSISCSCESSPCDVWGKIKDFPESSFHRNVLEQLNLNYIVDSSKNLCWLIDNNIWAFQQNLPVINLLVWKKPQSIAHSHWKRKKNIQEWESIFTQYYSRFFQTNLPFISICYNDFVKDPSISLKALCDIIGMPYFPGKELFWKKRHHYLYGSTGVRKQIFTGASTIHSTENFHPEFLKYMDQLNTTIERSNEVQKILKVLDQTSYLKAAPVKGNRLYLESIQRPYWYYLDYPRRFFRRYFPKKFVEA
jgi:hypothetical protein